MGNEQKESRMPEKKKIKKKDKKREKEELTFIFPNYFQLVQLQINFRKYLKILINALFVADLLPPTIISVKDNNVFIVLLITLRSKSKWYKMYRKSPKLMEN